MSDIDVGEKKGKKEVRESLRSSVFYSLLWALRRANGSGNYKMLNLKTKRRTKESRN
jgi:hypothetical protein